MWGAVVEESALRRMNMALGDRVKVGDVTVEVRGIIAREPDRGLNAFASLGPRLMIPYEAVSASGLVQPGSLLNCEYRLRLPPGVSDVAVIDGLKSRFPDAGWRVRGLAEAGGGIRFWLDRLTQFIGLIGLSSLLVGGVGVGNAISSFLAGRLRTIATLKCLGAPERLVFSTYLIQLAALALVGVVIGPGDRRRPAVRRPVGDRRRPAGAGAGGALCLAARHRRRCSACWSRCCSP